MSLEFQSLLGTSVISTNELLVDGRIIANELVLPNGAVDGYVLTSDGAGVASWQPDSTTLLGDAIGAPLENRVDTLAGGTVQVTELVQLDKEQTITNKIIGETNNVLANKLRNNNNTWSAEITNIPEKNQLLTFVDDELKFQDPQWRFIGEWQPQTYQKGNQVRNDNRLYEATAETSDFGADWKFVLQGLSNENKSLLDQSTSLLTPNTLVKRDASGNFSANIIQANLDGNASTVTTNANLSGDITSVGNVTTASASIVKTTATQTLTNKTLTLPKIAQISNTGTLTLPTTTTTIIGRDTSDTLTNKNITGTTNTVSANSIRYTGLWNVNFSGIAPTANQVLTFNGSNAVWNTPTSISGVVPATPDSLVLRDSNGGGTFGPLVSGYTTHSKNLTFGTQVQNKIMAIYDTGTLTDQTSHNFNGFGQGIGQLRYQTNLLDDHVFYGATTSSASNELLRIKHDGNVSMAGDIACKDITCNTITVSKLIPQDRPDLTSLWVYGTNSIIGPASGIALAGNDNTLQGRAAGLQLSQAGGGSRNTYIGSSSATSNTSGNNNTAIGWSSGYTSTGGSSNTYLGADATNSAISSLNNVTCVGAGATVSASNTMQLGNSSLLNVNTSAHLNCNNVNCNNITCASVTSTGLIASKTTLRCGESSFVAPNGQGSYMGWNRVGGSGRTTFMNQRGLGSGGFEWCEYDNNNVLISPNPLMSLDNSGNLNVAGIINKPLVYFNAYPSSVGVNNITTTPADVTDVFASGGVEFSNVDSPSISPVGCVLPYAGTYRISFQFFVSYASSQLLYMSVAGRLCSMRRLGEANCWSCHGSWILTLPASTPVTVKAFFQTSNENVWWNSNGMGAGVYRPGAYLVIERM